MDGFPHLSCGFPSIAGLAGRLYAGGVALHPLAARFASVANAYERGRPDYAPAVAGALAAELGLKAGAPVLDLAAGTGKLSRALLAAGLDVIAVEPQEAMREKLAGAIGTERVRDGVAEAIPLPDASVEAVTVADGFHWFDQAPAVAEIRRVLRPRGGLAVLTTLPDWSGASWAHDVGTLLMEARPEHPYFDGPPWHEAVEEAGGWTAPREIRVTTSQPADPEGIVAYVASMSFVAALPEEERTARLEQVAQLVEAGETPAELSVQVVIGLTTLA
jgi:ubiquinone/menaquinone biosynthesis C-methylase UbiE